MSIQEVQIDGLRQRYADLSARALPGGAILITVASVALPAGWNKTSTSIRFLVPAGYPFAAPDCFWADNDLLLDGGRMPCNAANNNVIPETEESGLWFSWHLLGWNPNRETLSSWMNTIADRLRRLQ
ncbi:E2/UBC family protein [Bradyrhizobium sp. DASA03120]|uniref:E2/UBC family protein n=1 Tax=Bradyrhizobium sp. SMVTL-02 TaxID=3395917 RepID=UPI003F6E5DE7